MIDDLKKFTELKMKKSLESLRAGFSKIRTGRAHIGILDHVTVDYYGAQTQISQVANLTLSDARTISVTPWDKNVATAIEKAIRESDLGLNPNVTGEVIRVPMPILTEQRRKDLIKIVKSEAENIKIAIRSIRRDSIDTLKGGLKNKTISEDDDRRTQDDVQKLTDRYILEIDKALHAKETDLMAV